MNALLSVVITCSALLGQFAPTLSISCNITNKPHRPSTYLLNETFLNPSTIIHNDCDCNAVYANRCIKKCCDVGYVLSNKTCTFNSTNFDAILSESGVLEGKSDAVFSYLSGGLKCVDSGYYVLNSLEFVILENGKIKEDGAGELVNYDEFCVDFRNEELSALVCFPEETMTRAEFGQVIGMMVSVPFLLATFLIYAALPSRKLHGNALMCYVISLLGGFVLLAVLRLKKFGFSETFCMGVAVPCIFFFLASFFWMNVMSIDIWWTFSGLGGFKGSRRNAENKRFLIYSAYAWGAPLLLGIVILILSASPSVPRDAWYNPGVGHGTACWFREALQELLYFYGLLTGLTVANIILFSITAYKIRQAHNDTAMLRKSDSQKHGDESDTQRFSLYLKLLLVMGLNWSMEIISYVVDWQVGQVPPAVWYITDFCNALYGVLIFFLFCFNKKTWNLLKLRFKFGTPETSGFSTQSTVVEARPLKSS